jgi:hypothetical protein
MLTPAFRQFGSSRQRGAAAVPRGIVAILSDGFEEAVGEAINAEHVFDEAVDEAEHDAEHLTDR